MTTPAMLAVAALLVAPAVTAAEDHRQMRAAERDLRSARAHLQAADPTFEGHRREAVEHVDKALEEIHRGLAVADGKGSRSGHRPKGLPGAR